MIGMGLIGTGALHHSPLAAPTSLAIRVTAALQRWTRRVHGEFRSTHQVSGSQPEPGPRVDHQYFVPPFLHFGCSFLTLVERLAHFNTILDPVH